MVAFEDSLYRCSFNVLGARGRHVKRLDGDPSLLPNLIASLRILLKIHISKIQWAKNVYLSRTVLTLMPFAV
jgi:hypothetical protein